MRRFTLIAVAIAALIGCDGKDKDAAKSGEKDAASAKDGGDSKDGAKDGGKEGAKEGDKDKGKEGGKEGAKDAETGHVKPAATREHLNLAGGKSPWASFKPGSFTKMKTVTEVEAGGSKHKTESTTTYTLKDVTDDEVIVETEMVIGNAPARMHEMKMARHGPEHKAAAAPHDVKSGTDEVEVAGKHLKCHWTETEIEVGGAKTTTKVFMNEEVPGFTVKTISKNATMTTVTEVVEFQAK